LDEVSQSYGESLTLDVRAEFVKVVNMGLECTKAQHLSARGSKQINLKLQILLRVVMSYDQDLAV